MEEHFDLGSWATAMDRASYQAGKLGFLLAPVFGVLTMGAMIFLNSASSRPSSLFFAIFVGLAAGGAVGFFAAVLATQAYFVSQTRRIYPVRGYPREELGKLHEDLKTIRSMNPPIRVLEETLELQAAVNQVMDAYAGLRRALPKEDLTGSAPYKWIVNAQKEAARVREELEEVRFQSYLRPMPDFSMEGSRRAIQEEKDFVSSVLHRSGDSTELPWEAPPGVKIPTENSLPHEDQLAEKYLPTPTQEA